MTGPEHYREAERLLSRAIDRDGPDVAATAQVHATLALAAATAAVRIDHMPVGDSDAWRHAALTPWDGGRP